MRHPLDFACSRQTPVENNGCRFTTAARLLTLTAMATTRFAKCSNVHHKNRSRGGGQQRLQRQHLHKMPTQCANQTPHSSAPGAAKRNSSTPSTMASTYSSLRSCTVTWFIIGRQILAVTMSVKTKAGYSLMVRGSHQYVCGGRRKERSHGTSSGLQRTLSSNWSTCSLIGRSA